VNQIPKPDRIRFWKTFTNCHAKNPNALRSIVMLMALYLHMGPFSRSVVEDLGRQIAATGDARRAPPHVPAY
jgi:hypothetical protein